MTEQGPQERLPAAPPQAVPAPPTSRAPKPRRAPASPRPRRSPESVAERTAIALSALLFAVTVNFLLMELLAAPKDRPADRAAGSSAGPGVVPLHAGESYVETLVQPNGEVVVRQWIRPDEPFRQLQLALPTVPGAEDLSAARIEVVADGVVVEGPDQITGSPATYTFAETTDVGVSYQLYGALERSDSAVGRALVVATSLDVGYEPRPERETRVVLAPEVLSLACSPSLEEPYVPCGEADGDDQWQVELVGPHVVDRVIAQLNLE